MPIVGTPSGPEGQICCELPDAVQVPIAPKDCRDLRVVAAPTSQLHKQPLLSRMKSVRVSARQAATIEWQMTDQRGIPLDLTECLCDTTSSGSSAGAAADVCGNIRLRIWEVFNANTDPTTTPSAIAGDVVDAAQGRVRFQLTGDQTGQQGIYYAEAAIVDNDANGHEFILISNIFYLYVQPSSYSDPDGPPTIAEIRLHLRDSAGAESFLLDHVRFDDAEISMATIRPVQYWNEIPPPIRRFSTNDFPYRYHWLEAICAQLFLIANEHYRANNLKYSAAGVAVDDYDKEVNYERAYQLRQQNWLSFVKQEKYRLNAESMMGYVPSQYFGWY